MDTPIPGGAAAAFDPSILRYNSWGARTTRHICNSLCPVVAAVLRVIMPNTRFFGLVIATRREDVEAILNDTEAFAVRFGARVASLYGDNRDPFGLGTDEPLAYFAAQRRVSCAMRLEEIPQRVAHIVRNYVAGRVAGVQWLDLGDVARLAQANVARHYLGLEVSDDHLPEFALWCVAVGNYAFSKDKPGSREFVAAQGAVTQLTPVVHSSIKRALNERALGNPFPDTMIGRLVAARVDARIIETTVVGMAVGMMSASTMAVLNAAQVLLARPYAMEETQLAAIADDDELLTLCLLEAVRFKPIFPGTLRDCVAERVVAAGTWRQITVKKGDLVLPLTQSAMMDGRRVASPRVFNPRRAPADTLVFGFGRHWCTGFAVGRAQLLETLKPLLKRGFYQTRADRLETTYFGSFPESLPVRLR